MISTYTHGTAVATAGVTAVAGIASLNSDRAAATNREVCEGTLVHDSIGARDNVEASGELCASIQYKRYHKDSYKAYWDGGDRRDNRGNHKENEVLLEEHFDDDEAEVWR